MARGVIRKPSFYKIVGAYRSAWKRFWMRLFTFGAYGSRGIGWLRDPKRAWYNFWYYRSSVSVYRLLGGKPSRGSRFSAMLVALIASIFAAPVDATRAAVRVHRIKQARKERCAGASAPPSKPKTRTGSCKRSSTAAAEKPNGTPAPAANEPLGPLAEAIPETTVSSSGLTPKSAPKNKKDRYIRKRMVIADSFCCDRSVLERLTVGAYFDLIAEPKNHDQNAVAAFFCGQRIGCVAEEDRIPIAASLHLGRSIYGVITDISMESGAIKFEYEAWFDSAR